MTLFRNAVLSALCLLALAGTTDARARPDEAAAIRQAIVSQQAAWNRGDIDGFMRGYKDAPDTTFVGATVRKGFRLIRDGYRRHYASRAQMGQLSFSAIDVRLLPGSNGEVRYAAVTGRFQLQRSEHGAAPQDDGVFSLLWQKTPGGWKIILDHTS